MVHEEHYKLYINCTFDIKYRQTIKYYHTHVLTHKNSLLNYESSLLILINNNENTIAVLGKKYSELTNRQTYSLAYHFLRK